MSRTSHRFGLVLIDVDQFKELNDGYGHGAGDRVLTELSRRLGLRLRDEDLLARIGGDEFAAIITNIDEMTTLRTVDRDLHQVVAGSPFPGAGDGDRRHHLCWGRAGRKPDDELRRAAGRGRPGPLPRQGTRVGSEGRGRSAGERGRRDTRLTVNNVDYQRDGGYPHRCVARNG